MNGKIVYYNRNTIHNTEKKIGNDEEIKRTRQQSEGQPYAPLQIPMSLKSYPDFEFA